MKRNFVDWLRRFWASIEPAWPAAVVLLVMLIILLWLWDAYPDLGEIPQAIYNSAWGTVLDIMLVGIIIALFAYHRARKERIERYLEEINDFKKWDDEQARLRIAGNVRRLVKLGKTDIDFSGIILKNFSFSSSDINSLQGSIFSHGATFVTSQNSTELENVDFSFVDCSDVDFSKSTFSSPVFGLVGTNLNFISSKLNRACFDSAQLKWTDYKSNEDDWYVDHGIDEYGPMTQQIYYPPFHEADLKGCTFRYAKLDHADFRGAINILEADFTGAQGLETCYFDVDVRDQILKG